MQEGCVGGVCRRGVQGGAVQEGCAGGVCRRGTGGGCRRGVQEGYTGRSVHK